MIHLDSSIVVAHLRGDRRVAQRLEAVLPEVGVSTIVLAELFFGVRVSNRPEENLALLNEFTTLVELVPFDAGCADAYGRIRADRRRAGRPIGEADALIAAVALTHGSALITHNVRHFDGIEGLVLEDWLT